MHYTLDIAYIKSGVVRFVYRNLNISFQPWINIIYVYLHKFTIDSLIYKALWVAIVEVGSCVWLNDNIFYKTGIN